MNSASLIPPVADEELTADDLARVSAATEFMGFDANDVRAMARVPGLISALQSLVAACYQPGLLGVELKRLAAYLTSRAAGCRYCEGHTKYGALNAGIDPAKLEAVWTFESSPLFTPAEKAALRLARDLGIGETATLSDVRRHFDANEAAELLAMLSLFAFLNRWNTVAGTTLEAAPSETLITTPKAG